MTAAEEYALAAVLDRFARADMALARREGEILIGRTLVGTVVLRHNAEPPARGYVLATVGFGARIVAEGSASAVRSALAALYDVRAA